MNNLLKETQKLIRKHGNMKQVSEDLNLSYRWIQQVKAGDGHDYGVRKIQRLYNYLSEK